MTTVRLQKICKGFWEAAALMSAVELEVFTAIARGHNTIAQVADAVGIDRLNAERLLVALAGMQLVARSGDTFANMEDVERFLNKDSRSYAGEWMLFGKPRWDGWGDSPLGCMKVKRNDSDWVCTRVAWEPEVRAYHEATYSIGMGAARWFINRSISRIALKSWISAVFWLLLHRWCATLSAVECRRAGFAGGCVCHTNHRETG